MAVGRVLLVAGVLVLLFIPYLLWGTGLYTARAQAQLRNEFAAAEHRAGVTALRLPAKVPPAAPTIAPPAADPPLGDPVGVISIPTISLSMVIVEGTGEAQLQDGPGHYPATPMPGEPAMWPSPDTGRPISTPSTTSTSWSRATDHHRDRAGDLRLHVTSSQAVLPTDVAVVDPTPTPTLTLTTCNPRYSASQRLVVHAALVASVLAHPKGGVTTVVPQVPRTQSVVVSPQHDWLAAILGRRGHRPDHGDLDRSPQDTARLARIGDRAGGRGVAGGGVLLLPVGGAAAAGKLLRQTAGTRGPTGIDDGCYRDRAVSVRSVALSVLS